MKTVSVLKRMLGFGNKVGRSNGKSRHFSFSVFIFPLITILLLGGGAASLVRQYY